MGILSFIVLAMMTHGQQVRTPEYVHTVQAPGWIAGICEKGDDPECPSDAKLEWKDRSQCVYRCVHSVIEAIGDSDTESGPAPELGNCTKNSSSCTIGIPPMPNEALAEDVPAIQKPIKSTLLSIPNCDGQSGVCFDGPQSCSDHGKLVIDRNTVQGHCERGWIWTCSDLHHYTLLTSVDGQVHVCHRILK